MRFECTRDRVALVFVDIMPSLSFLASGDCGPPIVEETNRTDDDHGEVTPPTRLSLGVPSVRMSQELGIMDAHEADECGTARLATRDTGADDQDDIFIADALTRGWITTMQAVAAANIDDISVATGHALDGANTSARHVGPDHVPDERPVSGPHMPPSLRPFVNPPSPSQSLHVDPPSPSSSQRSCADESTAESDGLRPRCPPGVDDHFITIRIMTDGDFKPLDGWSRDILVDDISLFGPAPI